ncbi:hypothetical protein [Francisella hispaniensis]|uniref:hypothetical protein n=1 Tax=Francisella hispaniensis TaxID=622488 RepID=UPI001907BC2D|nr:hypothetical protein [Francisella hispaniensis]
MPICFSAQDINQKWVIDKATEERQLYLCVIIYLFSKAVISWSMDKRLKAELVHDEKYLYVL